MTNDKRILLHGYVIMPNHIHTIYTVIEPNTYSDILRDFHKFTAQQMIKIMKNQKDSRLSSFQSGRKDRIYQIWQSTHSPKNIESYPFFRQKLEYIHYNPCAERWQLCNEPEEYPYSSAKDYLLDIPGILKIEKVLQ